MATERDFAMAEVKQMVEQCQSIADEFEAMSKHTNILNLQLIMIQLNYDHFKLHYSMLPCT